MKMKTILMLMTTLMVILTACNDDVLRTVEEDRSDLQAYLTDNNISVDPTESGLYYIETKAGSRFPAAEGEFIVFTYSLTTITGVVLTEDSEYWIDPSAVNIISGLMEGILLMNEGGEATMIIPPELAYGAYGTGEIEENMTLVFEVQVTEVKGPEEEEIRLQTFFADSAMVITPTESGLYFHEVDSGNGLAIQDGDNVLVKYTGKFLDGTVFSETSGVNYFDYDYMITSVIPGFEEGIGLMKHGGKATLILPYELAYGEQGTTGIYPYTTLIYEVELISVD